MFVFWLNRKSQNIYFFIQLKSNLLILTNITKINLLLILSNNIKDVVYLYLKILINKYKL